MAGLPQIEGYEDLVEIGRGGFTVVYRAHQSRFDRVVAVKVLERRDLDAASLRRFDRECRAIGALSWHPNVVVVHDSGTTEDGEPYLAMEYLAQGSLGDRVRRHGPLRWEEAVSAGVQVAAALATAHEEGTLHRDVKPENILIGRFGEAKLGDFGVALVADSTQSTTGTAFTVAHAAPEVLRGGEVTEQADVYSLGSTLFHLMSGRPAFSTNESRGPAAVILRAIQEPVPDLRPRGIPVALAACVERAMAKDPDDRQPAAVTLGAELQAVQREVGVPVTNLRVESRSEPSPDPVRPPQRTPTEPDTRTLPGAAGTILANALDATTSTAPPATAPSPRPLEDAGTIADRRIRLQSWLIGVVVVVVVFVVMLVALRVLYTGGDTSGTSTTSLEVRPRSEVPVTIGNGTGISGAASRLTQELRAAGYTSVLQPSSNAPNAVQTVVYYLEGWEAEALEVADELRPAPLVRPLPDPPPFQFSAGATVVIKLGTDLALPTS